MAKMNPEDARLLVREREYKNRAEEDAAVRDVDRQVWDKVRTLEKFMMEQADALGADRQAAIADALDVSEELAALTKDVDRKRVPLNEATARQWQVLNQRAEAASETLDRIERDVEHVAEGLSDPYKRYQDLVNRFPLIRPNIQFN